MHSKIDPALVGGLHYQSQGSQRSANLPIILLHGMFGSLDNLNVIAKALSVKHSVIQVDLRNHGLSPWYDAMDYSLMAQDVIELMDKLALEKVIIIGHSMGGKVAMELANLVTSRIEKLVVLDIAPITYQHGLHTDVFKALNAVMSLPLTERKQILPILLQYLPTTTAQFILKSYQSKGWAFNFASIQQNYPILCSWRELDSCNLPILFIKGAQSDYISEDYYMDITQQFPYAVIKIVADAGHNVHVDQPQAVIALIESWL